MATLPNSHLTGIRAQPPHFPQYTLYAKLRSDIQIRDSIVLSFRIPNSCESQKGRDDVSERSECLLLTCHTDWNCLAGLSWIVHIYISLIRIPPWTHEVRELEPNRFRWPTAEQYLETGRISPFTIYPKIRWYATMLYQSNASFTPFCFVSFSTKEINE